MRLNGSGTGYHGVANVLKLGAKAIPQFVPLTEYRLRVSTRRMITLTHRAADRIQELEAQPEHQGKKLRILIQSGGCSGLEYGMTFDEGKANDLEFTSEGVTVRIDPKSHAKMDGAVIDFDDGLHGKGFDIRNPHAQATCGCGKSFT